MNTQPNNIQHYYSVNLAKAPTVVRKYYEALNAQDGPGLLATLTDDFTLTSPLGDVASPGDYAKMVGGFGGWVETSNLVVSGAKIAHFFTFHMTAPVAASIRTCDLIEIENGKISANHHYANVLDFPVMEG